MKFAYTGTKYDREGGVTATLSAEWDTHRDACLAAKLHYNLPIEQFNKLLAGKEVKWRGNEIQVREVRSAVEMPQPSVDDEKWIREKAALEDASPAVSVGGLVSEIRAKEAQAKAARRVPPPGKK